MSVHTVSQCAGLGADGCWLMGEQSQRGSKTFACSTPLGLPSQLFCLAVWKGLLVNQHQRCNFQGCSSLERSLSNFLTPSVHTKTQKFIKEFFFFFPLTNRGKGCWWLWTDVNWKSRMKDPVEMSSVVICYLFAIAASSLRRLSSCKTPWCLLTFRHCTNTHLSICFSLSLDGWSSHLMPNRAHGNANVFS